MPKKVLPSEEDFARIEQQLSQWGFRSIFHIEVGKDIQRLDLFPPRKREGREAGFSFTANALSVVVWTTWLREEKKAREEDSGWVLIESEDEAEYFSRPLHRSKYFARNILKQAWIARWRVLHRPLCRKCDQYMDIVFGKGLKSRYWCCNRLALHSDGESFNLSWDFGLPPKARKFVTAQRKKRRKSKTAGTPAMLRRKTWRRKTSPDPG